MSGPYQMSLTLRRVAYSGSADRWYDRITNKEVLMHCTGHDTLSNFLATRRGLLSCRLRTCRSPGCWVNPPRRTCLFDVTCTNQIADFQIVHDVAARIASPYQLSGQIGYGTTTHSDICGGVLYLRSARTNRLVVPQVRLATVIGADFRFEVPGQSSVGQS